MKPFKIFCCALSCLVPTLIACGGGSTTTTTTPPPPASTETAAINTGQTYQTIVGFGGAEAFYTNLLIGNSNSSQLYTALFDPTQGLGVTVLRLQDVYQNSNSGTCTDPVSNATVNNCFDSAAENIASEASSVAGSGNLQILMSSWSPPANLKSTGSINGGTLAQSSGAYEYSQFASYLSNSIAAYRAENVSPTWVSLQNEPNFIPTSYASCGFGSTEGVQETDTSGNTFAVAGYPNALDAAYAAVQSLPSPPTLIGPETDGLMGISTYLSSMNSTHYGIIAHHLYNVSDSSGNYVPNSGNDPPSFAYAMSQLATSYPSKQIFETEYYNNASSAGSDNYGFDAAWTIHESLTQENAAMYLYWALVWNDTQQGLIYIDGSNGIHYQDQYYAMKHFSHFIRPGYKRVGVQTSSSSLAASAYISADGKTLVAVLLNTSLTTSANVQLNFTGFAPSTSSAYVTQFNLPSGTTNPWNNVGSLNNNTVTLPAESIATVVLQ
jgi:glucuronoarabinoxylan endo-1,4-beta-xylanase